MAFTLTDKRRINWPVNIELPVDGGTTETQTCTAEFEIINQDEYDNLIQNDVAFCQRVVVGFGADIKSADGTPLICTTENKTKLFKAAAYIRLGFINAYHEAAAGLTAKNLKGRPGSGQTGRKPRKQK